MWRYTSLLLLLTLVCCVQTHLHAEEALSPPSVDAIGGLIKDLDSDKYAVRDAATRRLTAAGEAAIGPLSEAVAGSSREASARALDILAQLFDSPQQSTRAKARITLEQLAKNTDPQVARRAEQVLRPEPPQDALIAGQARGRFLPQRIGPGQGIQIIAGNQIQIGRAGNLQIKMVQANNRRAVDVNENGKQIHIEEDERGIDVTLTEKVGDQQKVTAFGRKKNLAELKQAEPEAAKLYEKYAGNRQNVIRAVGNIQIQVQGGPAVPVPQPAPQIVPPPVR